jgi:hypothetical protein
MEVSLGGRFVPFVMGCLEGAWGICVELLALLACWLAGRWKGNWVSLPSCGIRKVVERKTAGIDEEMENEWRSVELGESQSIRVAWRILGDGFAGDAVHAPN